MKSFIESFIESFIVSFKKTSIGSLTKTANEFLGS